MRKTWAHRVLSRASHERYTPWASRVRMVYDPAVRVATFGCRQCVDDAGERS